MVAGDIDPEAVRAARGNARLNEVAPLVKLYAGPGTRHPAANRPGSFDLILANILARPLMRLAPSVARVLAPRGTLILSGLLPRDVTGVLSAYGAQNIRLQRRRDLEGWATLTLRAGRARPARLLLDEAVAPPQFPPQRHGLGDDLSGDAQDSQDQHLVLSIGGRAARLARPNSQFDRPGPAASRAVISTAPETFPLFFLLD